MGIKLRLLALFFVAIFLFADARPASKSKKTSSSSSSSSSSSEESKMPNSCPVFATDSPMQIANRALELMQQRDFQRSRDCYHLALKKMPKSEATRDAIHHNLGGVYLSMGEFADAAKQFREALKINPNYESAAIYLATALANSEDERAARKAVETCLKINPYSFEALTLLARIERKAKNFDAAIKAFSQAASALHLSPSSLQLAPEQLDYQKQQISDELVAISQEIVATGNRALTKQAAELAISVAPRNFMALWVLARLKHMEMEMEEAIDLYERARLLLPVNNTAEIEATLGNAYRAVGQPKMAAKCFERALSVDSTHASAMIGAVMAAQDLSDFNNPLVIKLEKEVYKKMREAAKSKEKSELPLLQPFFAVQSPTEDADFAREVAEGLASIAFTTERVQIRTQVLKFSTPVPVAKSPVRIGYLVRCWEETLFFLISRVFASHTSQFTVLMYWIEPKMNPEWVRKASQSIPPSRQYDVTEVPDEEAATKMNADKLVVLVDFGGYHNRERYNILTWRPAPHQVVQGVGWPASMGNGKFVQNLVVDRIIATPETSQFYNEKLILLPHSYQPNNHVQFWKEEVTLLPRVEENKLRTKYQLPLRGEGIVFANFGGLSKIDKQIFDTWIRIVKNVKNSKLVLLLRPEDGAENLKKYWQKAGNDKSQLVFLPHFPQANYAAILTALTDIFVDTRVYNSHTVGSDALYAKLPVVTFPATNKIVSRVGASHAQNVNNLRFVARTLDDYVDIAVELSKKLGRYEKVLENQRNTPLFDFESWMKGYESSLFMSIGSRLAESNAEWLQSSSHIVVAE